MSIFRFIVRVSTLSVMYLAASSNDTVAFNADAHTTPPIWLSPAYVVKHGTSRSFCAYHCAKILSELHNDSNTPCLTELYEHCARGRLISGSELATVLTGLGLDVTADRVRPSSISRLRCWMVIYFNPTAGRAGHYLLAKPMSSQSVLIVDGPVVATIPMSSFTRYNSIWQGQCFLINASVYDTMARHHAYEVFCIIGGIAVATTAFLIIRRRRAGMAQGHVR